MTEQTQPTDAEILDTADDFRSQYKHGGTTFDEFDALGFARAVLAKWGTPAGAGEPYGCVTTHCKTGQQFFYRHPEPPYLDNASECVTVYAKEKHARQSHQDNAQVAGDDTNGAGATGRAGADQHHEHRVGESNSHREEPERDSGRTGVHGPCDVSQEIAPIERLLAAARNWGEVEPYLCRSGSGEQRYRIVFGVHERAAHFARELLTTPQPTQAQAGAVPLKYAQLHAISLDYSDSEDECTGFRDGWRAAEKHHGIKEADHG